MTVAGMHYTNSDQLFTYFLAGILEQGGDYFAEDGKHFNFNSPEAVATIQKLMDMAQKDGIVDPIIFNAGQRMGWRIRSHKVTMALACSVRGMWAMPSWLTQILISITLPCRR